MLLKNVPFLFTNNFIKFIRNSYLYLKLPARGKAGCFSAQRKREVYFPLTQTWTRAHKVTQEQCNSRLGRTWLKQSVCVSLQRQSPSEPREKSLQRTPGAWIARKREAVCVRTDALAEGFREPHPKRLSAIKAKVPFPVNPHLWPPHTHGAPSG